ncbi:hypothetical protein BAE29_09190 [Acidithiobacillus caldus]|uniref:Uncharacterized protein n=2 Tax=Acidithiobacillus caldus TaxID=33059 RepID=A0A1E7YNN4_9PROT|nr:hypothetical protein BAE27_05935 [Acidithiobacillus caldus]OFC38220.1 hypothetical protein BAE29_09190 [Acidithiobacillus caldus]OFC39322.1 hypothetical protein BAE28_03895 [Acidithiobacillus caldus]OFC50119.1 hypothetical protein BAE30_13015 [Acidithiobacillus caldus]
MLTHRKEQRVLLLEEKMNDGMRKLLQECGLSEASATDLMEIMEKELGSFSLRTVSENLIQDQSGNIRVTKRAEPEYRRLFAMAGMNMRDYLNDRNTFFKAFRRANSLAFDKLIQSDHELPFL